MFELKLACTINTQVGMLIKESKIQDSYLGWVFKKVETLNIQRVLKTQNYKKLSWGYTQKREKD